MTQDPVRDRTKANPHARGTSNKNKRGSSYDVRRRKEYLLKTYAADWPLVRVTWAVTGETTVEAYVVTVEALRAYEGVLEAEEVPTARCFRCGALVWFETISVDKIVPDCKGGTYRRENIRPACDDCQTTTGNQIRVAVARGLIKKAVRKNKPREVVQ